MNTKNMVLVCILLVIYEAIIQIKKQLLKHPSYPLKLKIITGFCLCCVSSISSRYFIQISFANESHISFYTTIITAVCLGAQRL